jgi:hypothetical protein
LSSLTAIFGSSDEKPVEESEKLLQLYWNRAELKKEFAGLRDEEYRLKDLVKQKDGAVARVQQKLDHLERLLYDPDWVYNVIIYYQLRNLNLRCQSKIEKFAEQIKQQREQRQHGQVLNDWNAQSSREAAGVDAQIGEQRLQVQLLEDKLQAERHRLATMSRCMRVLRGRSVTANLDALANAVEVAQRQEEALLMQYDGLLNRLPPDTEGLDVATKRLINYMILAYAQHLFLHFGKGGLAGLAKESGDKSVGAINYGDKDDCDQIIARIRKRTESLEKATDLADVLRQRAKLIAAQAEFRNDSDAVPVSATVATVFRISEADIIREKDVNLLGENYWNLANILSR